MFTREKTRNEARAYDAGARYGHLPATDDSLYRRPGSQRACARRSAGGDKKIFLSTQHDASVDDPKPEEIYAVGTLANIVQSVKLPDGKHQSSGGRRGNGRGPCRSPLEEGFLPRHGALARCACGAIAASRADGAEDHWPVPNNSSSFRKGLNYDTMIAAARVDDPARLSDTIAAKPAAPGR